MGCGFCQQEMQACIDHETAKGCANFQQAMETKSVGSIIKDMVKDVNGKLDHAAVSERALIELRLRALRDEIDDAMMACNRASEHVRQLLEEWK